MSRSRLLSGKVKKKSGVSLDVNRYRYLGLGDAEPDLGNPPFDGGALISNADGTRFWTDNIRIDLTGNIAVGTISSSSTEPDATVTILDNVELLKNLTVDGDLIAQNVLVHSIGSIDSTRIRIEASILAPDIFVSTIYSEDSSAITVVPSMILNSDLTVENELFVGNKIFSPVFVGDLQGNVTGNISGDITGNILGDVLGNVLGNLVGNVTGNITTNNINSADSSEIIIVPAVRMQSDLTVENELFVRNKIVSPVFEGDLVGDVSTNLINSTDSSEISIIPSVRMQSDLTVENELFVRNKIVSPVFEGDLQGNVTGNITGDISGNILGNVLGDVLGNLIGNVIGNVTGDITGNIITSIIDSADSSEITIVPAVRMQSDLTVENELFVRNKIVSPIFEGDLVGDVSTNLINSTDSSEIVVVPAVRMQSDLTVENELFVGNKIVSPIFEGDLQGNVTGNITGDISGNILGDVLGNVLGNLIGNVIGNVTGDITGNIVTSIIDSADSTEITFIPAVRMQSDLNIENELVVRNAAFAKSFNGDLVGDVYTNKIMSPDSSTIEIYHPVLLKSDLTIENNLFSDNITSNQILVDGDAVITGNLTVKGETTTILSTTLVVEDKNIELSKGSTSALASDGAGITVIGPAIPAELFYSSADDTWNFNRTLKSNVIGNLLGDVEGNITTNLIDSADSSEITVVPAVSMQSDLTVENELFVRNRVVSPLFVGDIQGNVVGDISGNITGNIIGNIIGDITTSRIDSTDSSEITIVPAVRMQSDLTIENELFVNNKIFSPVVVGDLEGNVTGQVSDITNHSIGELFDVDIYTVPPQDLQGLVWDSQLGKFVPGKTSDQDLTTESDVVFKSVTADKILTPEITSPDSSEISIVPAVRMLSNLTVENELTVSNSVTAEKFVGFLEGQISDLSNRSLGDLGDVTIVDPQDRQSLLYDASSGQFTLGNSLDQDLTEESDVRFRSVTANIVTNSITSEDSSEILFKPKVVFNSDIIVENEIFGKVIGQVSDISNHSIGGLGDVDLSVPPQNRETIIFNSATGKFEPGQSFNQDDFEQAFAAKTTDDLLEGDTNLYFTEERVRGSISAGTGVFYDEETGEIAIGQDVSTDSEVTFLSVSASIITNDIYSSDSSLITIHNRADFQSDVNIDNNLFVKNNVNVEGTIFASNLFIFDTTVGNFQGAITSPEAVALFRELITNGISSIDSSPIRFLNSVRIESDLFVENEAFFSNSVTAERFIGFLEGQVSDITNHKFGDLSDVNVANPQDGQSVIYDSATSSFILGNVLGQDLTINSDVAFNSLEVNKLTVSEIDSPDSAAIVVVPSVTMLSDLTVENELTVRNRVFADRFVGFLEGQVSDISNRKLDDLGDVEVANPTNGQTLVYDAATSKFKLGNILGQDLTIGSDVSFNSVTANLLITPAITTPDSSSLVIIPAILTKSDLSVDGDVLVTGNLTVQGTTTTINSTTLTVADKNIELAKGANSAAAANGAGITVLGPAVSATFIYDGIADTWNLNKTLNADVIGSLEGTFTGTMRGNLETSVITTIDSTELRIVPGVRLESYLAVEDDVFVTGAVEAAQFIGNLEGFVSTISNHSIGDLTDVDITTTPPQDRQALVWDNGRGQFVPGQSLDQDLNTNSNATFESVTADIFTTRIDSTDSSEITVIPKLRLNSDLTVENELFVNNGVFAESIEIDTATADRFVGYLDGVSRDFADTAFTNKTLTSDVESQDQVLFFDISANEVRRSTIADAAIRGYTGSKGADGDFGGASFYYTFEDTYDAEIGTEPGFLLLDDTDLNQVSFIALNVVDRFGNDITSFIQTIDDSTSDIKGYAKITEEGSKTNFVIFAITDEHVIHDDHFHIPVAYVSGVTTAFDVTTNVVITFTVHGDKGDIGYTGSKGDSSFSWGPNPPPNPEVGARWYDSVRGILVVYVDDGDTLQWVEVSAGGYLGRTGFTGSAGNLSADIDLSTRGRFLINDGVEPRWSTGSLSFRNRLINGNFDVWQRGVSQTASGYGSADRWTSNHVASTKIATREEFAFGQTAVPNEPRYYIRHSVTSVNNPGEFAFLRQSVESSRTLEGKTATLSFWAKADANKYISVEFVQNFGSGGTPSAQVTGIGTQKIAVTDQWQKYVVTAAIPSITGKVLGTAGNDSLQVHFWFDAGSSLDARTGSLGAQSGVFDLAQVQLEESDIPTNFERRMITIEEQLCYRYYFRWTATNTFSFSPFTGTAVNSTLCQCAFSNPVSMRAIPTTVSFGGNLRLTDKVNNHAVFAISLIGSLESGSKDITPISFTVSSGLTEFRPYFITANNDATAFIEITAEI